MVKIIERVQAHYESREMPFGKTYEWHPAYVVLECGCGRRWTIDAKSTITTCQCGRDLANFLAQAFQDDEATLPHALSRPGAMTKKSVHNNTSVTSRLILKARPGVTTILRRPPTRSEPKEKKSLIRA